MLLVLGLDLDLVLVLVFLSAVVRCRCCIALSRLAHQLSNRVGSLSIASYRIVSLAVLVVGDWL